MYMEQEIIEEVNAAINEKKTPRRATSLGGQIYRTEEINQIVAKTQRNVNLLVEYLDIIRNYRELTQEMLDVIITFDDRSKMLITIEYNTCMNSILPLLEE